MTIPQYVNVWVEGVEGIRDIGKVQGAGVGVRGGGVWARTKRAMIAVCVDPEDM